jgi:hypothetical protein
VVTPARKYSGARERHKPTPRGLQGDLTTIQQRCYRQIGPFSLHPLGHLLCPIALRLLAQGRAAWDSAQKIGAALPKIHRGFIATG